jgi:hypothetical protein
LNFLCLLCLPPSYVLLSGATYQSPKIKIKQ